jgi:hypothetical protein
MAPGVSCTLTHETFNDGVSRERIRFGQERANPPSRASFDSDEDHAAALQQHEQIIALFGPGAGWKYNERNERVPVTACPDCNAPVGGLHHPGCDTEICPHCGLQAIGCPAYAK